MTSTELKKKALTLCQKAKHHYDIGEVSKAIHLYTKSIDIYPTAESYTSRGLAYCILGKTKEAIQECKKAIEVDPYFGKAYNDIGTYLMSLGKIDEAVVWLKKAKKKMISECKYVPYLNLARIYFLKGLLLKAEKEFKKVLELIPGEFYSSIALTHINKILH
jgi:tetratricopeptide (TPR) repeat protein